MSVYYLVPIIKSIYRKVLPLSVRESVLIIRLKHLILQHVLGHNAMYDSEYYTNIVEGLAVRSVRMIAESILFDFKPSTVVDVGCGTGALLEILQQRGCVSLGLEYSEAALKHCRARGLNVIKFNLEKDILKDDLTFDVAISREVAEHLPEKIADRYVDLLKRLSYLLPRRQAREASITLTNNHRRIGSPNFELAVSITMKRSPHAGVIVGNGPALPLAFTAIT